MTHELYENFTVKSIWNVFYLPCYVFGTTQEMAIAMGPAQ